MTVLHSNGGGIRYNKVYVYFVKRVSARMLWVASPRRVVSMNDGYAYDDYRSGGVDGGG